MIVVRLLVERMEEAEALPAEGAQKQEHGARKREHVKAALRRAASELPPQEARKLEVLEQFDLLDDLIAGVALASKGALAVNGSPPAALCMASLPFFGVCLRGLREWSRRART